MDKIGKTLQLIKNVLSAYLAIVVGGKKFKGKITITINCNDGGIGNVEFYVEQSFNQKSIEKM